MTMTIVFGMSMFLVVLFFVAILISLKRTTTTFTFHRDDALSLLPLPLLSQFSDLEVESSWIWQLPCLQTPRECQWILEEANAIGFVPSQVKDYKTEDASRQSMTCWISPNKSTNVASLYDFITRLFRIPRSRCESLQIVKYTPKQYFKWHYDTCDPEEGWCQDQITRFGGQRLFTVLLYLNDEYKGGETQFVENGLHIRGRTGDAVVFRNLTPENRIEPRSLHQGSEIIDGTKYIANLWIRG